MLSTSPGEVGEGGKKEKKIEGADRSEISEECRDECALFHARFERGEHNMRQKECVMIVKLSS